MDPTEKKLVEFYRSQSLAPEKAAAILAEGKRVARQRRRQQLLWRSLGVAAAVTVVGSGAWLTLRPTPPGNPAVVRVAAGVSLSDVEASLISFFSQPDYELDQVSLDQAALVAWLESQGAPANLRVPAVMDALDNLGCEVLSVKGQQVYVLCFYMDGVPTDAEGRPMPGKKPMMTAPAPDAGEGAAPMMKKPSTLVHLVSVPREQFNGAPRVGDPVALSRNGEWSFATWAEGEVVYIAGSAVAAERFAELSAALQQG